MAMTSSSAVIAPEQRLRVLFTTTVMPPVEEVNRYVRVLLAVDFAHRATREHPQRYSAEFSNCHFVHYHAVHDYSTRNIRYPEP